MDTEDDQELQLPPEEIIAVRLNNLLANYSLFYQNTRGFFWNITGGKSLELHKKFEELYRNLQEKIDGIANRILALGYHPENIFSEYISLSLIPESKKIWEEEEAIANILESYSTILTLQKEIVEKAIQLQDRETAALLNGYISFQEEQMLMYSAYIEE